PAFETYFRFLHHHLRQFDRLVFHSGSYRDAEYARLHGLTNTIVIPNAVRREEFGTPPPPGFRARQRIPDDAFLVLLVANYTGAKGQEDAIEIIARADVGPTILLLVGRNLRDATPVDQALARPAAALAERSSGSKTVICAELPRGEVIEAFFAADLFLFPSQIECSPLVLFE